MSTKEEAAARTAAAYDAMKAEVRASIRASILERFEAMWVELTRRRPDLADDMELKDALRNAIFAGKE